MMKKLIFALVLPALAFFSCGEDEKTENKLPTCTITSPAEGDQIAYGQDLVIKGTGSDPDGRIIKTELTVGTKIIEKVIAVPFEYTVPAAELSEGNLKITLRVTDDDGAEAKDEVTVKIQAEGAPRCEITEPADGALIPYGEKITVKGNGSDPDGEIVEVKLTAGGKAITAVDKVPFEYDILASELTTGEFKIILEVKDNDGLMARDEVTVIIGENKAPTAKITEPADGSTVEGADKDLTIKGEGSDEDGTIETVVLKINGNVISTVTAVPFTYNYPAAQIEEGEIVIELEVTDNAGAKGADKVTVMVLNQFTDARDGNVYKTVKLGDQVWMAQNLRYLPSVNDPNTGAMEEPYYYVYDYEGTDVAAAKATDNYSKIGVLYNFEAVGGMDIIRPWNQVPSGVQGVCPDGWHMPSSKEWDNLFEWAASQIPDEEGVMVKDLAKRGYPHWSIAPYEKLTKNMVGSLTVTDGWRMPASGVLEDSMLEELNKLGQDRWGFSIYPSGWRNSMFNENDQSGNFAYNNQSNQGAAFWCVDLNDNPDVLYPYPGGGITTVQFQFSHFMPSFSSGSSRRSGYSVRCIQD